MSSYALVDATNIVQNVVTWDGNPATWQPPAGITPILLTGINAPNGCGPGYTFNGTIFVFGQLATQITATNLVALLNKAQVALANNLAYLAIPSPTQAQAIAQVQALTQQVDAIIRIILSQTDSTQGT